MVRSRFLSVSLLFTLAITGLAGCDDSPPLPEEKMIDFTIDLAVGEDTLTADGPSMDVLLDSLYLRHDVTAEEYQQTVDWYKENPGEWRPLFEKVIEKMDSLRLTSP